MFDLARLKEILSYDPETGVFRWKQERGMGPSKVLPGQVAGGFGGGDDGKYWRVNGCYGHRLAWFYHYGEWPKGKLDHIDGNKINNAIGNLRIATTPQNGANAKLQKRNKLRLKGVRKRKCKAECYEARLGINGKMIVVGYFKTAQEAHEAYLRAAREHFGEFARGK